jgi:hypothetical protein
VADYNIPDNCPDTPATEDGERHKEDRREPLLPCIKIIVNYPGKEEGLQIAMTIWG